MLVSHRHRFIAMKTLKTGSTSVEIYLEPFCAPPELYQGPEHLRPTLESADGIIAFRGRKVAGQAWYNHMPAALVRDRLGPLWDSYLKLCVVRHPLDREVSWFWFKRPSPEREALAEAPFAAVLARFRAHLAEGPALPDNAAIHHIDGRFALDLVLRHETLAADLAALCARLGLPWEPARLGRYKANYRTRAEPWEAYYDPPQRAATLARHAAEAALFGYR
jgi:hypothetical protein